MMEARTLKSRPQKHEPLQVDWSKSEVIRRRAKYLSPSLSTFEAYSDPIVLKRGEGQYLWDHGDRKYLDCLSQNLTISVGYNHPLVREAVFKQYSDLAHCTTMFYNAVPGHFAEEIVATLPSGQDWVLHFVNSGAEAIDLAILLARVYTENFDLICLRNCYHGLHFTTMGATGMQACRQNLPASPGFLHVAAPDQYHGIFGATVEPYVKELANLVQSSTSGQVAGLLLEPIQGYTGVIPLPRDYVPAAVALVRSAGGLYIADEVQTGLARTGENFWGFEHHDCIPDIVVMGKGISNGLPVAAVAARRDVAEAMCKKKFFNTFGSNPVGCAAGRAVLQVIEDEGLQENASRVGRLLKDGLVELQKKHWCIGDVRGRGLMIGIEIVSDVEGHTPAPETAKRLHDSARSLGLILGRAGPNGNIMRVCPPYCINVDDASFFLDVIDRSLTPI
jgi:alanine-glyoxylate transaminase/(R)-3-amino-2-methylpropionate-pyruvate transaminase